MFKNIIRAINIDDKLKYLLRLMALFRQKF